MVAIRVTTRHCDHVRQLWSPSPFISRLIDDFSSAFGRPCLVPLVNRLKRHRHFADTGDVVRAPLRTCIMGAN
jgi:hypothetical protein